MKRAEILSRLGFTVPGGKRKRVIIHSDIANEADDYFAIIHHLVTPAEEIEGIIAGHNEWMPRVLGFPERYSTMERSYQEGNKLLKLAEIDDVPLLRGSDRELQDLNVDELPDSEGADFIIDQAKKEDCRPLYVAVLGSLTDMAIAYLKEPSIAEKIIVIWIGGGMYPEGEDEFNLKQDILAARVVFDSPIELWQIPKQVYKTMEVSLSELMCHVSPCGELGAYLCRQMVDLNEQLGDLPVFPHGESWCIGDNPTISVLLQSHERQCWHAEPAPCINNDCTYASREDGKSIRVYDSVDTRMTVSDLFAKLKLCYGI